MRAARLRQPAAAPLPGRARVRALRAQGGRRHDRPPRRHRALAGRAARAARRRARGARRGLRAVGRARLARRASRARTSRSRRGSRSSAEFVEVAHRVGGVEAAKALAAQARAASSSTPSSRGSCATEAEMILADLDSVGDLGRGDRRRAGARRRALGRALRRRAPGDRELRRPQVAVHPRPRARGRRPRGARPGAQLGLGRGEVSHAAPRRPRARLRPARHLERDLGQAPGRSAPASGSASACTRT